MSFCRLLHPPLPRQRGCFRLQIYDFIMKHVLFSENINNFYKISNLVS